jgi:hypothetical protein
LGDVQPGRRHGRDGRKAIRKRKEKEKEKGKYIRVQPENSSSLLIALPSEVSLPCALLKICRFIILLYKCVLPAVDLQYLELLLGWLGWNGKRRIDSSF